jgi:hypothetical protein
MIRSQDETFVVRPIRFILARFSVLALATSETPRNASAELCCAFETIHTAATGFPKNLLGVMVFSCAALRSV